MSVPSLLDAAAGIQRVVIRAPLVPAEERDAVVASLLPVVGNLTPSITYLVAATPRFTGEAVLYVEAPKVHSLDSERRTENPTDSTTIESQVEILQSDAVVEAAVTKLGLAKDPNFVAESQGFLAGVFNKSSAR